MQVYTLDILGPPVLSVVSNEGSGTLEHAIKMTATNGAVITGVFEDGGGSFKTVADGQGGFKFTTDIEATVSGQFMVSAENRAGSVQQMMMISAKNVPLPNLYVIQNNGQGSTSVSITVAAEKGEAISFSWASGGDGIEVNPQTQPGRYRFQGQGRLSGVGRFSATNERGTNYIDIPISIVNEVPAVSITGPARAMGDGNVTVNFTVSAGATVTATAISGRGEVRAVKRSESSWSFTIAVSSSGSFTNTFRMTATANGQSATHDIAVTINWSD